MLGRIALQSESYNVSVHFSLFNMDLSSLFVLVLISRFLGTLAEVQLLDNVPRTWLEARKACREEKLTLTSCDLVTKEPLDNEFSKLGLADEADNYYWVGGQRLYQWKWDDRELPLFEDHGCYRLKVSKDLLLPKIYMSPHECYRMCRRSGYQYLQGNHCFCNGTLEGAAVSPDLCRTRCEGSAHTCGGEEDIFSVYSVPEEFDFEDHNVNADCAVGRDIGSILHIETLPCLESRHYFCLSDLQEDSLTVRRESFNSAASKCRGTWKSTMPSLAQYNLTSQFVTNYKTLIQKLNASVSFWLPLQRANEAVWTDGVIGDADGRYGECLAADRQVGSYRVVNQPCSSKHRTLCDCKTIKEEIEEGGRTGSTTTDEFEHRKETITEETEEGGRTGNTTTDEFEHGKASSSGLSSPKIAGIVLAVLVVIAILIILGLFLYRKYVTKELHFHQSN